MKKITCVANQMAGAGKTTTAVNLALCLSLAEKRTLLVDADPQGDATACLADAAGSTQQNLYHVLTKEAAGRDIVVDTPFAFLRLLPSGPELFQADYQFGETPAKDTFLRECLMPLRDEYDYIVIDSPSSLGFLMVSAIIASDSLLLPLLCRPGAVEQLGYLLQLAVAVRQRMNFEFKISGILLNRCRDLEEARTNLSDTSFASIENIVFPTTIPVFDDPRHGAGAKDPLVAYDVMAEPSRRYFDLTAAMVGAV